MKGGVTAERLRRAVEALPAHTKRGMLQGIRANRVIVGAYTDKRGGVCPMLAAHRNGGRTDFSTFAKAWDAFTGAKRARRASAREVRTLRGYLEVALIRDGVPPPETGEADHVAVGDAPAGRGGPRRPGFPSPSRRVRGRRAGRRHDRGAAPATAAETADTVSGDDRPGVQATA